MEREKINIVDKDNNLIGVKYRDEVDYSKDIYQVSALWVTNSNRQVLMARRKLTKDKDPGMWGPAVAGTVDEGETYESNIYKEAEEEIGLTGRVFKIGPLQYKDTPRKHFTQWYFVEINLPLKSFTPQESEVEQLVWIDQQELVEDVKNNPDKYVSSLEVLNLLLSFK